MLMIESPVYYLQFTANGTQNDFLYPGNLWDPTATVRNATQTTALATSIFIRGSDGWDTQYDKPKSVAVLGYRGASTTALTTTPHFITLVDAITGVLFNKQIMGLVSNPSSAHDSGSLPFFLPPHTGFGMKQTAAADAGAAVFHIAYCFYRP